MCWTVAGVHGGSEPGQSSTRSNKDRVHKEEVGKPDAGHLPPLPTKRTSQGTKNRRQARQAGGGVECVWPRRSVWLSRRLHRWWCSRQEWGAAVHMHQHNLTALASPPHSFHHHHFVCDVRTKVKRKYWMMFVHYSIIFKRCIPQKTSLRILNHHGLFFYCVLSILRSCGSHQKFSKQEKNL